MRGSHKAITAARPAVASPRQQRLALLGGDPAMPNDWPDLFRWPIVTAEDEQAVLEVLRSVKMSGWEITQQFEAEWSRFQGTEFSLGHCNGTMALLSAMFGVGVGRGDEVICPAITYWASVMPCALLGATAVFADIDPVSLCIDPADIEHRITPRTRAIVVVHYCGYPCDMDSIMALARRHGLKVIEDASHAHGGYYKGRMVGSIGDVAGMSMMTAKGFSIGEGGMLCTNDREIYECAIAFCHYERCKAALTIPSLRAMTITEGFSTPLPLGGLKGRMNQTCAAMGRVQLRYFPERVKRIQQAINYFWDLLEGVPGLRPHRVDTGDGSTMGAWYNPLGRYAAEELGEVPVARFAQAVNAEGGRSGRGINSPLHVHAAFNDADIFGDGKPTRLAFSDRDVRQPRGSLPVAEGIACGSLGVPYFKDYRPEVIEGYAAAWRKVALNADQLREGN